MNLFRFGPKGGKIEKVTLGPHTSKIFGSETPIEAEIPEANVASVVAAEQQLSSVQGEIDTLQSQVQTLQSDNSTKDADIAAKEAKIAEQAARITQLENEDFDDLPKKSTQDINNASTNNKKVYEDDFTRSITSMGTAIDKVNKEKEFMASIKK